MTFLRRAVKYFYFTRCLCSCKVTGGGGRWLETRFPDILFLETLKAAFRHRELLASFLVHCHTTQMMARDGTVAFWLDGVTWKTSRVLVALGLSQHLISTTQATFRNPTVLACPHDPELCCLRNQDHTHFLSQNSGMINSCRLGKLKLLSILHPIPLPLDLWCVQSILILCSCKNNSAVNALGSWSKKARCKM